MSEQVRDFYAKEIDFDNGPVKCVLKSDYDALHAEAEALRADNEKWQRRAESARGLIRYPCKMWDGEEAESPEYAKGYNMALEHVEKLNATQAPEVQGEQGERQGAVARRRALLITSYCGDGDAHCTDESPCADCLSMCNVVTISGGKLEHVGQFDNLPGFNKLVLEDTSRDMLRLVKALEHYANCGRSGNVARVALAAHRQAQRKGEQP